MILEALAAFVAMFLADFVWAKYIKAIADHRRPSASSWAVLLMVLSGVATITYVNNHWMLIPAALGAFAGTWFSVPKPHGIYLLSPEPVAAGLNARPMKDSPKEKGP